MLPRFLWLAMNSMTILALQYLLILKNPFFFYFSGVLGSGNLIWGGGGGGGDESDFQDLHVE